MASERSRHIRATLIRDRAGIPLAEQRDAWERDVAGQDPPRDVLQHSEVIAGVETLRLDWTLGSDQPVILYAHGGGLVTGSVRTHRDLAVRLARACVSPVKLIGYRLLPENDFPAPLDDVLKLYHELVQTRRIPARQIVFGGDSTGAGLMLAAMMALRDARAPLPAGLFAISGAFDATLAGETLSTRAKDDPLLSPEAIVEWQGHVSTSVALDDPRLSPLLADVSHLPPVQLLAGDDDLWCDDSRRLAAAVEAVGGSVDLRIWDEMWHVWPMEPDMPETDQALRAISGFVQRLTA